MLSSICSEVEMITLVVIHWRCKNTRQAGTNPPFKMLKSRRFKPSSSWKLEFSLQGGGGWENIQPSSKEWGGSFIFRGNEDSHPEGFHFGASRTHEGPAEKGPAQSCVRGFPGAGVEGPADRAIERGGVPHSPLPPSPRAPGSVSPRGCSRLQPCRNAQPPRCSLHGCSRPTPYLQHMRQSLPCGTPAPLSTAERCRFSSYYWNLFLLWAPSVCVLVLILSSPPAVTVIWA